MGKRKNHSSSVQSSYQNQLSTPPPPSTSDEPPSTPPPSKKKHKISLDQQLTTPPSSSESQQIEPLTTLPPSKPSPPSEPFSQPNPSRSNRPKKQTSVAAEATVAANLIHFQRVFSDDDEIFILKSFLDFKSKTGNNSITDFSLFFDSFKDSLSFEASCDQVRNKVKKLKLKFKKGFIDETTTFSSPHEKELFKLSHIIWGQEIEVEVIQKKYIKKKKPSRSKKLVLKEMKEVKRETTDEIGHYSLSGMERGLKLLEESEREELERRERKLKIAELEIFRKRAELVEYEVSCILEALKEEGSS